MSFRAITLGLTLAAIISLFTYYNDHVIKQTYLLGNHLPAVVFGVVFMLMVVTTPVLGRMGRGWALRPGELGVILALGFAACGWPGSNLMRYFTQVTAHPARQEAVQAGWQAAGVMSYVPGGSPRVAEGHIKDWTKLTEKLTGGADGLGLDELGRKLRQKMAAMAPERWAALRGGAAWTGRDKYLVVQGINLLLEDDALWETLPVPEEAFEKEARELLRKEREGTKLTEREALIVRRGKLATTWGDMVRPRPVGEGVMLAGGDAQAVAVEEGLMGRPEHQILDLGAVKWEEWWPVARLWGGTALLLGLASLCLMLIVHPQWHQRELLPYTTATFVDMLTRREEGAKWPTVFSAKPFWVGFGVVAVIHFLNGMHAWVPDIPAVQKQFDFSAMKPLFPLAEGVWGFTEWLKPTLFFSAIGFSFFVTTRVSMSVGLSLTAWVAFGAWLKTFGVVLNSDRFSIGASGTSLRFGSYMAATVMIAYVGRRHYWQVIKAALGGKKAEELPGYAVWGARGLVLCVLGAVWLLGRYAGLDWVVATPLVLLTLVIFLVLARINAETGLFYAQADFLMGVMLVGMLGVPAVGPEALIVVLMASVMWSMDPREAVGPYVLNSLALGEKIGKVSPGRMGRWAVVVLLMGMALAGAATITIQRQQGIRETDGWSKYISEAPFHTTTTQTNKLAAFGDLERSMQARGLGRLAQIEPDQNCVWWAVGGFGLLLGCAAARLRLPWWPIHPVLFLIWGTYPAQHFSASFLIGALVKGALVWIGGHKAHEQAKPVAAGMIAAELLMILFWSVVGLLYYLLTGLTPQSYQILPG